MAHVGHMGKRRGTYRALVGNPEGKRQLPKPRRRWKNIIRICLQKMGWGLGWICLAQDPVMGCEMIVNLRAPYKTEFLGLLWKY